MVNHFQQEFHQYFKRFVNDQCMNYVAGSLHILMVVEIVMTLCSISFLIRVSNILPNLQLWMETHGVWKINCHEDTYYIICLSAAIEMG